jgi:hypothetical protein
MYQDAHAPPSLVDVAEAIEQPQPDPHEWPTNSMATPSSEVAPVFRRVGYLAPMGPDWMVDEAGWAASAAQ